MKDEVITIGGKIYEKFIRYPTPVNDGTARCFSCGQIDEEPYHDNSLCPETAVGLRALAGGE